jgi:hypothetical protein
MKNIFLLLALFIIVFANSKAQNLTEADLNELESLENVKKPKPVKSKNSIKSGDTNLSLSQMDKVNGLILDDYQTSSDRGRYSLLFHGNGDLMNPTGLMGFEFLYAKKLNIAWWEVGVSRTQVAFDEIADINNSILNATATELEDSTSTLLNFSTGLAYSSNLIQNLVAWHDYYETSSAHVQYVQMSEEITGESLSGFGLKADFGIHKRSSKNVHYGLKMSYNFANVKRPAVDETESSSARSLAINWISLAFDLTYYF